MENKNFKLEISVNSNSLKSIKNYSKKSLKKNKLKKKRNTKMYLIQKIKSEKEKENKNKND